MPYCSGRCARRYSSSPIFSEKMERRLISLLNSTLAISQFKQVHSLVVTSYPNLIQLLTKKLLGALFVDYGRKVFDQIPHPDQTVYNSVISTYSRLFLNKEAIEQFMFMRYKDSLIDCYTIPPVLKSCSSLVAEELGKQVHSLVVSYGLDSNVYIQAALVHFYSKVGELDSAKKVFDGIFVKDPICYNCLISGYSRSGDVSAARKLFDEMTDRTTVSWNAMLSCYAHNGDYLEGFRLFEQMQAERFRANEFTVVTVLSICAKLGNLEMGLRVKKFIDDNNLCSNMVVSTALMEMYVKCGQVDEARLEFDHMVERDVVAWSAMIAGYAQNGKSMEALELFEQMICSKIKPNDVTLVSVLSACAQLGSVDAGEKIGSYVESHGLDSNVYIASALLGMYSKCGNITKTRQIFEKMPCRDVVTWNSMVMGLAINGLADDAFAHYETMKQFEVKPDDITFVGLLTACTHAGLLDIGLNLFKTMQSEHGISAKIEHCACIVDLFCRSGKLKQAYDFICNMEVEPNAVIWGTLLSSSNVHMNIELAEISVRKLVELEPENSGNYVILSNMYASVGRWQEAMKVRSLMKDTKLRKIAAYSWIALENNVHKFLVGDTSHPRSRDVYNTIDGLIMHTISSANVFHHELELC